MKVPAFPPDTFILDPTSHVRTLSGSLWRVFRTEGAHSLAWNELRHYGPIPNMRFDPQPPPTGTYLDIGVMYAATRPVTALGEVYQATRVIDRSMGGATIASWIPSRPLVLLDLTSNWPVVNGAAAAMMMNEKASTQAWARAICERHGDVLDGLYHQSTINNEPLVTLISRTERVSAFPDRVRFSARLSDATADEIVAQATKNLGYVSL